MPFRDRDPPYAYYHILPTLGMLELQFLKARTVPADLSPEEPSRYECHILWADGTDDYHNVRWADELRAYLREHLRPGETFRLLVEKVVTDDPDRPAYFQENSLRNLRAPGRP